MLVKVSAPEVERRSKREKKWSKTTIALTDLQQIDWQECTWQYVFIW